MALKMKMFKKVNIRCNRRFLKKEEDENFAENIDGDYYDYGFSRS